jgi:metal-responsive CopG/Arc/MetJ family transcriptional regulator
MKSDTKLVSITVPTDWWAAATRLADKRGQTRSELIRSLLWEALSEAERKHLSEPQTRGRPAKIC